MRYGFCPLGIQREGGRLAYQQVSCDIKSFEGQRRKQLVLPQELSKDPHTEGSCDQGIER